MIRLSSMYGVEIFLKQTSVEINTGIIPHKYNLCHTTLHILKKIMQYNWQRATTAAKTVMGTDSKRELY